MNERKESTGKKDQQIKIRVDANQKRILQNRANSAGQKCVGTYLRTLGLNMPLKSVVDQHALDSLLKCKADLGRLGVLFKLYLTSNGDKPLRMPYFENYQKVADLLEKLEESEKELLEIARRLL